jgi:hypothetical protein
MAEVKSEDIPQIGEGEVKGEDIQRVVEGKEQQSTPEKSGPRITFIECCNALTAAIAELVVRLR